MNDNNNNSQDESNNESQDEETLETHGWLEQFEALTAENLVDLQTVVDAGLTDKENENLIMLSAKLIQLAQKHDPEALDKVSMLLTDKQPE